MGGVQGVINRDWSGGRKEMEGSGDGRVTSKAKGTGGGRCNMKSRLGLLPKDPSQPDPGQRETSPAPGRGQVWAGVEEVCGQSSGTLHAQGGRARSCVKSPGQRSSNVSGSLCSLWCPPKPSKPPGMGEEWDTSCLLFSRRGSLEHLFCSCPKALVDVRYRWCHDQVLGAVAESIATTISIYHHAPKKEIPFTKLEKDPQAGSQTATSFHHKAPNNWAFPSTLPARYGHLWVFKTSDHAGTYSALKKIRLRKPMRG